MSTIRPNIHCTISKKTVSYDAQGRSVHSERRKNTKCAVVWLKDEKSPTSVRSDRSASGGYAEESTADARILLRPNEDVSTGDIVKVRIPGLPDPISIEVRSIFRRPNIDGRIHHIQVEGELWVSD